MPASSLLFKPALSTLGALHLGVGLPGMTNASFSLTALHPLEIEIGVEGSLGHNGVTARAGPALRLVEHRKDSGRGVTMHAPLLVGWRYWNFGRPQGAHSLTLNPTLTTDFWLAPHLAIELQLTLGASLTVHDPSGGIGSPIFPDGQLRLGLAF